MTYTVGIVTDPHFGPALIPLAQRLHVWACSSPENVAAANTVRSSTPTPSLEVGVTIFASSDEAPEEMLLGVLGDVELHHGSYSHNPAWGRLEIYGATPTPEVRAALAEFGVEVIEPVKGGFRCERTVGSAA